MYGGKQTLLRSLLVVLPILFVTFLVAGGETSADVLRSTDYQLQPTVGNSFGGSVGSTNYQLTDSGGEAVIGDGAGGSYKLGEGYVAQLQHGVNLYVEPSNLVAYWPMNEGAGPTIHDASANDVDGTTSGSPTWVTGQLGKALQFNGGPDSVKFGNIGSPQQFTMSFWVNPSELSSTGGDYRNLIVSSNLSDFITLEENGGISFSVPGVDASSTGDGGNVPLNKWTYVTVAYDQQTKVTYINGDEVLRQSIGSGTVDLGSLSLVLPNSVSHSFKGELDDIKVYGRVLTTEEVKANYEAGLKGFDSGLVIPSLLSGASQSVGADVIISADAPYSLLTNETSPLTSVDNSSVTIPPISASIANPAAWQEGTTEGLGFTVISGPSGVPAKWDGGSNYAGVPSTSTTFYTRTGFSGGSKDVVKLLYRLDVSSYQQAGRYKNSVVYTATVTP